jgi:REP element-mobilizing transposase RayT
MGIRKIKFVNEEYYHVFNRGVDKRTIYESKEDLYHFFTRLATLNTTDNSTYSKDKRKNIKNEIILDNGDELVSIVAYCLLPNHFHLLLKQRTEDGVSKFMQRIGTSYTKFFNEKYQRSGSLFQGKFKANHVTGDLGLPTLSSYVNLNYYHHRINPGSNIVKSSIFEYLNTELGEKICDSSEIEKILSEVGGLDYYKEYSKNTSIVFAKNKGVILTGENFEF